MGNYLASPVSTKQSENGEFVDLRYGVSSMQGWRVAMEDSHVVALDAFPEFPGTHVFGVFDGHGGCHVSRFVAHHLVDEVRKSPSFCERRLDEALQSAFLSVDHLLFLEEYQHELQVFQQAADAEQRGEPSSSFSRAHSQGWGPQAVADDSGGVAAQLSMRSDGDYRETKDESVEDNSAKAVDVGADKGAKVATDEVFPNSAAAATTATTGDPASLLQQVGSENGGLKLTTDPQGGDGREQPVEAGDDGGAAAPSREMGLSKKHKRGRGISGTRGSGDKGEGGASSEGLHGKVNRIFGGGVGGGSSAGTKKERKHGDKKDKKEKETADSNGGGNEKTERKNTLSRLKNSIQTHMHSAQSTSASECAAAATGEATNDSQAGAVVPSAAVEPAGMSRRGNCGSGAVGADTQSPLGCEGNPSTLDAGGGGSGNSSFLGAIKSAVMGVLSAGKQNLWNPLTRGNTSVTSLAKLAGCTSIVALVDKDRILVANAGDSRCVLCRGSSAIELSQDHKPHLPAEKNRIYSAGGQIEMGRINGNLNLSRAIGDLEYKQDPDLPPDRQIVTAMPELRSIKIQEDDEFFVIGCDGIWEKLESSQYVVDFVRSRILMARCLSDILEDLFEELLSPNPAIFEYGCDNMTAMIIDLKPHRRTEVKMSGCRSRPAAAKIQAPLPVNSECGESSPISGQWMRSPQSAPPGSSQSLQFIPSPNLFADVGSEANGVDATAAAATAAKNVPESSSPGEAVKTQTIGVENDTENPTAVMEINCTEEDDDARTATTTAETTADGVGDDSLVSGGTATAFLPDSIGPSAERLTGAERPMKTSGDGDQDTMLEASHFGSTAACDQPLESAGAVKVGEAT